MTAYRGVDAILDDRLARFRERRAGEREEDEHAAKVFAARQGRIAAGAVGAWVAVAMFVDAVAWKAIDQSAETSTFLLPAGWIAAGLAMVVMRARSLGQATRALRRELVLTGDAPSDLALVGAHDPLGQLRARATAQETKSVAFPLAALSLLAPLTIHGAIAFVACNLNGARDGARDFGFWIAASAILVGLAHAALVLQVVLWARSLRRRETARLRDNLHGAWARALALTSVAALVPGVFVAFDARMAPFALIPPLIVLVTGGLFLPFAYLATARRLEQERAALGEVPAPSPAHLRDERFDRVCPAEEDNRSHR